MAPKYARVLLVGCFLFGLCACADVSSWKFTPDSPMSAAIIEINDFSIGGIALTRLDDPSVTASAEIGDVVTFVKPEPHVAWMGQFKPGRYALASSFISRGQFSGTVWVCDGTFEFEAKAGEVLYLGKFSIGLSTFIPLEDNFDQAKSDVETLTGITSPLKRPTKTPTKLPWKPGLLSPHGSC